MVKIKQVRIQRFRSIMDLTIKVETECNTISICGQNNVGKTNTIRAINLFFCPDFYEPKSDIPTLKNATWGGSVHPKIELTFVDEGTDIFFCITRNFDPNEDEMRTLLGYSFKGSVDRKTEKIHLEKQEIDNILSKIVFIYIESINTFVPTLINSITQDVLNLQYDKARFSTDKRELKEAYDTYVDGLQKILNAFSSDISNTFKLFRDNWQVEFIVPKNSDSFRALISDDVRLTIKDKGSSGIVGKGSGLQRLAHILMEF